MSTSTPSFRRSEARPERDQVGQEAERRRPERQTEVVAQLRLGTRERREREEFRLSPFPQVLFVCH